MDTGKSREQRGERSDHDERREERGIRGPGETLRR